MRFAEWVGRLADSPDFPQRFDGPATWTSLAAEARPPMLAARLCGFEGKALVVSPSYERAIQWQARLALCGIDKERMRVLPSGIASLFEDAAPESVALSDRIGALRFLTEPGFGVVIATADSALERTLPPDLFVEAFLQLSLGAEVDLEAAEQALYRLGYERADLVRVPGQLSRRGGLLDIYAMGSERPVRIELFGDQIESMREFDPMNQRSLEAVESLTVAPSREVLPPANASHIEETIKHALETEAAKLSLESAQRLRELVIEDMGALHARAFFNRLDLYRPYIHPDAGCAIDLLNDDDLLVLDEPIEIDAAATRAEQDLAQSLGARHERGEILKATVLDYMLPPSKMAIRPKRLSLTSLNDLPPYFSGEAEVHAGAQSLATIPTDPQGLAKSITNWRDQGVVVIVATDQPRRATTMLSQVGINPEQASEDGLQHGIFLSEGNLAGGFLAPSLRIAVVTDKELFGVKRLKLPHRRFNEGIPVTSAMDLKPGDYVVHISYGIGIYQGLVTRTVEGIERELLYIEYKSPDKLYVPADQLDRVQKYLSPSDAEPKIDRISGGDWKKKLSKARDDARAFAKELIKLYAERTQAERPPYPSGAAWMEEMEATFPWVETPAQMQAIEEVKKDLTQREFPMDRLICGDVGFGKTEVAMRAAFKVVETGGQVAVLCPTTILSEQHARSFAERLEPFGVKVRLLNRFKKPAERRRILQEIKEGEADIAIGTHALLQKSVEFNNLALVVVDEEQRFGVKQKERLKALRSGVDVLSLSATPIPRTLSMSLMHIRPMSVIEDPPPGRLPIRTFVRPHSDEVVQEALLRELARGGQVYYVYNRVQGINHIAESLRKMLPNARIAVGHGQMSEPELAPIMIGFIEGEIDILVSTSIVENGLDIPNANTLIVENAERFGLSQLYQLRGRVGRSDRQAYAYLLYGSGAALSESALARLQALQEFSQLGSGYSLAFRDLQIRGAGDLLGKSQSGEMAAIGYDLYHQILDSEVQRLRSIADRGEITPVKDPLEGAEPLPSLDLPVDARIPEAYISDEGQRLFAYSRMMASRSLEELAAFGEELRDRYGRPPEPVRLAFEVMELRLAADALGVKKGEARGGRVALTFRDFEAIPERAFRLLQARNQQCYVTQETLVWPFTGSATAAVAAAMAGLAECIEQIEEHRQAIPAVRRSFDV